MDLGGRNATPGCGAGAPHLVALRAVSRVQWERWRWPPAAAAGSIGTAAAAVAAKIAAAAMVVAGAAIAAA